MTTVANTTPKIKKNEKTKTDAAAAAAGPKTKTKTTTKTSKPRRASGAVSALGKGQAGQTNRRAAAVLEVLAGLRTPAQAAQALGLSVNYYYILERKALAALVAACQVQPKGPPGPSPERQLARLGQELDRCRQECLRQASLVRAAERAIGLSAAPVSVSSSRRKKPAKPVDRKGRRRRRPTVRALRAARTLQQNSSWESAPVEVERSSDGREVATHVATEKESGDGTRGTQAAGGGTC